MIWTERDQNAFDALRKAGALEALERTLIPDSKHIAIIACGDGIRFRGLADYLKGFLRCSCDHKLTLPGGAALMVDSSAMFDRPSRDALFRGMLLANKAQSVSTFFVSGHWPCGAAKAVNMTFVDVIRDIVAAKQAARTFLAENGLSHATVIGLFDRQLSNNQHRTHVVRKAGWERYVEGDRMIALTEHAWPQPVRIS